MRDSVSNNKIRIGDQAPNFSLFSHSGEKISLKDLLKKSCVVLYFYPKDETSGCTAQACHFRDQYEVFKEAGAEVVGISSDSVNSHKQFAKKHALPFLLLSDENGDVRQRYGVPSTMGMLPGRVTCVIDQTGIVRNIFSSQFRIYAHIERSLEVLKDMN